jgi:hypothetical protein
VTAKEIPSLYIPPISANVDGGYQRRPIFRNRENRNLNPNLERAGHLFKQDYRFHGSHHKPRIRVLESHLLLPRNGNGPADRTSERAHAAASPAAFRPRASTAPTCRHVPPRLSPLSSVFPPLPLILSPLPSYHFRALMASHPAR